MLAVRLPKDRSYLITPRIPLLINNIKWQRNKDSFAYTFQGKERRYTPDFYLIDDDVYIEIKGYKTEKDDAKWTQFPPHRKLVVLMKKNLVEMKVI